ncbi:amylo-alpha-1,6-glucosidase [Caldivirga sp. UBA161]|uniref:amylo-alpha-1,6-glucosidase n=1 Tax=Caldivirga sp. UBA161 TaxID=1915569 RepID=UPI0025BE5AF3|nr:trehalase family glycosidase [Caldivirga sp. UBA161]
MRISDKLEISGNITSIIMNSAGIGLSRLFYGEYIEGELRGSGATLLRSYWDYGGIRRYWSNGAFEFASVYGDLMVYALRGYSGVLQGEFKVRGFNGVDELGDGSINVKHEGGLMRIKANQPIGLKVVDNGFTLTINVNGELKVATAAGGQVNDVDKVLNNESIIESKRRLWLSTLMSNISGSDLIKLCWYVILTNRCSIPNHPALRKPFNMPSKYVFKHQWLWDSSFHAIVLRHYDANMAMEELENLIMNQKPDGRIPHEIFMSKELCKSFWGIDDYSPWTTQPPVLAIAVDRILSVKWDDEFAKNALNALIKYDEWFRGQRDRDSDYLYAYFDPLESGWDNSPRWDEAIRRFRENPQRYGVYGKLTMAPVEAVDLNSLIYLQRRIIAKLARRLGELNAAEHYDELADETAKAIRSIMWSEEDGFFYDAYEENHELIKVKTPAAYLTMFAGIATGEQAERLVVHLFNAREFWTTFPLPSVSADESTYDPTGYWRGRSWINLVWFTYHGLRNYGYYEEASRLLNRVIEVMGRSMACNENYNSSTGEPMGAPDFGWSTLIIDMVMSELSNKPTRSAF